MTKIALIKDNVVYNENKTVFFDGTLEEAKNYLHENGYLFIRYSQYSHTVYYRAIKNINK